MQQKHHLNIRKYWLDYIIYDKDIAVSYGFMTYECFYFPLVANLVRCKFIFTLGNHVKFNQFNGLIFIVLDLPDKIVYLCTILKTYTYIINSTKAFKMLEL